MDATEQGCITLGNGTSLNSETSHVTIRRWHVRMTPDQMTAFASVGVFIFDRAASVTFVDCVFEGINVRTFMAVIANTATFEVCFPSVVVILICGAGWGAMLYIAPLYVLAVVPAPAPSQASGCPQCVAVGGVVLLQ